MPVSNKQEEFLALLEPVRESLSRFACAIARNRQDAHDLTGEAILIAYENFEKIKKKESFKSYIFTVISRLHKKKIRRGKFFGFYNENTVKNIRSPETHPEIKLDVQILYDALKLLPDKQREAIILFEISGFSLEEIKKIQGGTLSGVKSRLKRGRERLTAIMNPEMKQKDFYKNGFTNHIKIENTLNGVKPVEIIKK